MKQLGDLAIVVYKHSDCMLQIYNHRAIVHTGAGSDRKSFSFNANDKDCISEVISYLNFATPITNINIEKFGG